MIEEDITPIQTAVAVIAVAEFRMANLFCRPLRLMLFLLTLIRVVSPGFLVRHSRYAILAIVILAAVITPTGDVFNLTLFATPMIILFYIGIFASWLLVLNREGRAFPWKTFLTWTIVGILGLAALGVAAAYYYGFHFVPRWPLFVK